MAPSPAGPTFEDLERDLQAVLMDQNHHGGGGGTSAEELSMYRSGSAPPTVQGARAAVGTLFSAAPPAHVDNSGLGGADMLSEEEILSHPAYLQYYYNNEHLNPRLPVPMVSKEDWRVAQRFQAASGGIGDWRRRPSEATGGSSLFSVQPGAREANGVGYLLNDRMGRGERNGLARQQSSEWLGQAADGLIGLSDVNGLASRRKSFADALQENISHPASKAGHLSRSNSRNAFESPNPSRSNSRNAFESPNLSRSNSRNAFEGQNLSRSNSRNAFESPNQVRSSESSKAQLQSRSESMNGFRSGTASPSLVRVQSLGSSMSHTFASAVGSSISRSTTPDPQLMQRAPSPCLPPVGVRMGKADKMVEGRNVASRNHDGSDTAAALSAMSSLNLSGNNMANLESDVQNHIYQNFGGDQRDVLFNNVPKEHRQFSPHNLVHNADEEPINALEYAVFPNGSSNLSNPNMSKLAAESNSKFPTQSQHGNGHKKGSLLSPTGPVYLYQNLNGDSSNIDVPGRHAKANSRSSGSSMLNNHLNTDGEYANLLSNQRGTGYQVQPMDAVYAPYLQANPNSPLGAAGSMSPFRGSNFSGSGHMDNAAYQKAYLASLLAQQKLQYGMPYMGKSGGLSPTLYGSEQAYGMDMAYLSSPTSSHFIPSPQGHARQGDRLTTRIPSMARSTTGGAMGSWSSENGLVDNAYESTLLEEFKTNKTRSFELLDIVGHVVEFSSDQYGSRFIQQKLETASTEEKNMIFPEILPQARTLMTDVFGNYVIQKFFEYGTEPQQKQLANLLKGHVYTLSTQMYGCRVIQKALEVVGVEQQTQMALELDGNTIILKLVRDQNGNHVIQKCIECIPQERIQFIISAFYGQVIELSTHPYGCRVIQRVLEHCDDESTQNAMMEEIMQCVVPLTQDQYGNYVIQHVLQHGKPEERTSIIKQLAGQIVKMSQQKFASNVVEKCLSFGSPEERQILINEMLGTTDENEPLQAMMKDQFANYVVQKVLETCDDHNRELILSRIKVHLNALKRYTYGKHIVARVEKLIAAGERRIGVSSQSCRD
ncbi:Pumilio-like protein 4 [Triticum urartu]|uniref:Pumilio-like protein 4 n=1 Tax=Triticum urartu TaxID=4572 RepID=M7ZF94_TRIUA|nr:pumilio homolog 3-like [Triticum urartu]EMS58316.1 Pumilio-like protein 4 [Triticum urartu]